MISYDLAGGGVTLTVLNSGTTAVELQITNVYTNQTITATLNPNAKFTQFYSTAKYANWYDILIGVESDITFAQQLAGHMETGQPSTTDPRYRCQLKPNRQLMNHQAGTRGRVPALSSL